MGTLQLLLVLALLGYSLYSGIVYLSRRSGDKAALRTLVDSATPARELTPDERAAIAPLLVHPLRPGKTLALSREGVFVLEGPMLRHGITVQGSETMHDTLNGVDVVLPYDALDFASDYCKAEVVLTDKFALVISLDGGFELLAGRARARQRELQQQQWASGKQGELPDIATPASDMPVASAEVAEASQASGKLEILGQRDETPAETIERSSPGLGLLPGLFFILGFAGLLFASAVEVSSRPYWFVPAMLSWALALFLTWRKRSPGLPQKVNRVRGHVHAVALPVNGQVSLAAIQWFIGDKFLLKLPRHWRPHVLPSQTEASDIDMRVSDYSLLRVDKTLSIDEEVRRIKPVHWGRHLSLCLVGGAAALALLVVAPDLRADLLLSRTWASHGQAQAFDSAQAVEAAKLAPGSPVLLSGQARCEVLTDVSGQPVVDCKRLRWNGAAPAVKALEPDAGTLALHSGEFITAHSNPRLEALLLLRHQLATGTLSNNDPLQAYRASLNTPKIVGGLGAMITMVESACEPATADSGVAAHCKTLRDTLVEALPETDRDWAGWLKAAQDGTLTGERDSSVMMTTQLTEVRGAARAVADARMALLMRQVALDIQRTQVGGVVLQVLAGEGTKLPERPQLQEDSLEEFRRLNALATDDGLYPFSVNALLVAAEKGPDGALVMNLDATRSLADPWPSAMRTLYLAVALLLLIVHAVLMGVRWRAAALRLRELEAFNLERVAKRPFGF